MTRILVCGCPRVSEGHDAYRLVLPIRADTFSKWLKTRCQTQVRPETSDDNGRCDQAIMLIGVVDQADSVVTSPESVS